jgi:L-amino acid N-acyltransferase YncA
MTEIHPTVLTTVLSNGITIYFKTATGRDFDWISNEVYPHSEIFPDLYACLEGGIVQDACESREIHAIVAREEAGTEVLGSLTYRTHKPAADVTACTVNSVAVPISAFGQGIGTALIKQVLNHARQSVPEGRLTLHVVGRTDHTRGSAKWLERLGFVVTGTSVYPGAGMATQWSPVSPHVWAHRLRRPRMTR